MLTWAQSLPVPENRRFFINDELQYPVPVQRRAGSQFQAGIHVVQIPSEASSFHQFGSRLHYVPEILWIVIPIQSFSTVAVRSLQVHVAKIQIVLSIDRSKSGQGAPIHAFERGIPFPSQAGGETLVEARPTISSLVRRNWRPLDHRDPGRNVD